MNHITSSPHYPQSNGLIEKFVQIVKNLFHKAREEGADLFKALTIYRNTLLASHLQSPMQMLQSRTVRSQLPMSNAARQQLGLQTEMVRIKMKNEHLPSHDLCLGQNVMIQDPTSKRWSPAVITRLCKEPRSYQVTTKDGVTYRKMPAHLKPYKPEDKKEQEAKKYHMQTLTKNCEKKTCDNNLAQSRGRRHVKPPCKARSIIRIVNCLWKLACHKYWGHTYTSLILEKYCADTFSNTFTYMYHLSTASIYCK